MSLVHVVKYYRQMTSNHEVEYSYVRTYIQQLRHGGQSRPTITDIIQFAIDIGIDKANQYLLDLV